MSHIGIHMSTAMQSFKNAKLVLFVDGKADHHLT